MSSKKPLLLLGLLLCSTSCKSPQNTSVTAPQTAAVPPTAAAPAAQSAAVPQAAAAAAEPAAPMAAVPTLPVSRAAQPGFGPSSLALGLDLYGQLRATKGRNLVISPASISLAFAMTWTGASGTTADEMTKTLHFWDSPQNVATAAGELLREFNATPKQGATLRVVNQLFIQNQYELLPDFLTLTKERFAAPVEFLDFAKDQQGTRKHINSWVSERTAKRVPELLPKDAIKPLTRLVLANAVYFLGKWLHQFDPKQTAPGDFYANGETLKKVPMMKQQGTFAYAEADGLQILELPYAGNAMGMLLLLPNERNGLANLESKLAQVNFDSWLKRLRDGVVDVTLPRVEMRYEVQLKEPLQKLGMKRAFTTAAEFGGMRKEGDLYIDQAYHQAFIKLNEEGTEAAAATAVVMNTKSVRQTNSFRADRPFVFAIRDLRSGTILFLGRVVDPGAP